MSQYGLNDCPAEVRKQIEHLTETLKVQLAENLIGIYLHGSLAMNCFNPLRSDIDLLVVTQREMTLETKRGLAEFLLENSNQPSPFEISFLRQSDLSPWRYPTSFDFHYSEDWREKFERELASDGWEKGFGFPPFDEDLATHITITNHRGQCLFGVPISDIFPLVPKDDFIRSILADVASPNFGFEAVLQYPVYVVLNSCRTLAFLRTGLILSKDEGGIWGLENLPSSFHATITDSLNEYRCGNHESKLREEKLINFANFIRCEINNANY